MMVQSASCRSFVRCLGVPINSVSRVYSYTLHVAHEMVYSPVSCNAGPYFSVTLIVILNGHSVTPLPLISMIRSLKGDYLRDHQDILSMCPQMQAQFHREEPS